MQFCIDCKKKISRGHKRCLSCSSKGVLARRWAGGKPKCLDCGKTINRGYKRCVKCFAKGELNGNYKGGITAEQQKSRNSDEYAIWRIKIFNRDGFKCIGCGKVGGDLHAHHILSFKSYIEKRFDINNGITLCIKCHKKLHYDKKSD